MRLGRRIALCLFRLLICQGSRHTAKTLNLSDLRILLPQLDESSGRCGRYAAFFQRRRPCAMRQLLFDPRPRIAR